MELLTGACRESEGLHSSIMTRLGNETSFSFLCGMSSHQLVTACQHEAHRDTLTQTGSI
jgi:hypothetical protein